MMSFIYAKQIKTEIEYNLKYSNDEQKYLRTLKRTARYDSVGQMIERVFFNDDGTLNQKSTWKYDKYGRVILNKWTNYTIKTEYSSKDVNNLYSGIAAENSSPGGITGDNYAKIMTALNGINNAKKYTAVDSYVDSNIYVYKPGTNKLLKTVHYFTKNGVKSKYSECNLIYNTEGVLIEDTCYYADYKTLTKYKYQNDSLISEITYYMNGDKFFWTIYTRDEKNRAITIENGENIKVKSEGFISTEKRVSYKRYKYENDRLASYEEYNPYINNGNTYKLYTYHDNGNIKSIEHKISSGRIGGYWIDTYDENGKWIGKECVPRYFGQSYDASTRTLKYYSENYNSSILQDTTEMTFNENNNLIKQVTYFMSEKFGEMQKCYCNKTTGGTARSYEIEYTYYDN